MCALGATWGTPDLAWPTCGFSGPVVAASHSGNLVPNCSFRCCSSAKPKSRDRFRPTLDRKGVPPSSSNRYSVTSACNPVPGRNRQALGRHLHCHTVNVPVEKAHGYRVSSLGFSGKGIVGFRVLGLRFYKGCRVFKLRVLGFRASRCGVSGL